MTPMEIKLLLSWRDANKEHIKDLITLVEEVNGLTHSGQLVCEDAFQTYLKLGQKVGLESLLTIEVTEIKENEDE
ncbi:MAG: hypothetical protein LBC06_01190 [Rickettsiales bacterium]|jgi:hypothetical protein|nr:hypothetical protein [Rickettsiales bacterium]